MKNKQIKNKKRVLIVGGGFGGVACALKLAELGIEGVKITLVSNRPHFEYHGALYRLVTGRSPLEICIPLREVFDPSAGSGRGDVEVVVDEIDNVVIEEKHCWGVSGSKYQYDYLVLGLGSETSYYDTPGLKELSFGFKSINEALRLKRHLHELFEECVSDVNKEVRKAKLHFVVVGGGASGVELAGELATYTKTLAREHGVDEGLVRVDLVQSPKRLVSELPVNMSKRVEEKLRSLGVRVFLDKRVVKEDVEKVYLKDMEIRAKTLVWTAGVRGNHLYADSGLEVDKTGRVVVDEFGRAKGERRVFVVGDGAVTQWSGMAQTALYDGVVAAENIGVSIAGGKMRKGEASKPVYAIPVGPGWAAVLYKGREYYGRVGWILRRYLDWKVFTSILPLRKAWAAWREGGKLCETCEVCGEASS